VLKNTGACRAALQTVINEGRKGEELDNFVVDRNRAQAFKEELVENPHLQRALAVLGLNAPSRKGSLGGRRLPS
jgi:hypothetical protein